MAKRSKQSKMKKNGLPIFVFFVLLIPFLLKHKSSSFEIYPSIVMPVGASLMDLRDSISYITDELYGEKEGKVQRIDVGLFLAPIPRWYFPAIIKSSFGLEPVEKVYSVQGFPFSMRNYNRFSEEELTKAKKMYRSRLKAMGFNDSYFLYRRYAVKIEGDSIKAKKIYENAYCL